MPTQGFNLKSLQQDNLKLSMWDIGGQEAIRPYWKNYYNDTDALIYVVDSADEERISECHNELTRLLTEELLSAVPLLVFANKQDISTALDADEVKDKLTLDDISDRNWTIQACSATTQEGLQDGMDWLIQTINAKQE